MNDEGRNPNDEKAAGGTAGRRSSLSPEIPLKK